MRSSMNVSWRSNRITSWVILCIFGDLEVLGMQAYQVTFIAVIFNTKPLDSKYLWMSLIPRPHPACTLLPVYWKWSTLGSVWGLRLRLYIYHRSGNFRVAYNFCHAAKWRILNACVTIFRTFNFRCLSNWRKNFHGENFPIYSIYICMCYNGVN